MNDITFGDYFKFVASAQVRGILILFQGKCIAFDTDAVWVNCIVDGTSYLRRVADFNRGLSSCSWSSKPRAPTIRAMGLSEALSNC